MRIGVTYDLRADYLAMGYGEEETAELDSEITIAAICGALRSVRTTIASAVREAIPDNACAKPSAPGGRSGEILRAEFAAKTPAARNRLHRIAFAHPLRDCRPGSAGPRVRLYVARILRLVPLWQAHRPMPRHRPMEL